MSLRAFFRSEPALSPAERTLRQAFLSISLIVLFTINLLILGCGWVAYIALAIEVIILIVLTNFCVHLWLTAKGDNFRAYGQWRGDESSGGRRWFTETLQGFVFGYVVVGATGNCQTTLQLDGWLRMIISGTVVAALYFTVSFIAGRFAKSGDP